MIVKLIGWLASRPWIHATLYSMVSDREYKGGHLYDEDGNLYMGRWTVIEQGGVAGKLLSFLTLGQYDHVRMHWIKQPDRDRELHDHPFNYRTFVMKGWYSEQYIDADKHSNLTGHALRQWQGSSRRLPYYATIGVEQFRMMTTGKSAAAPVGQFHRISTVSDGGVWTLFAMGMDHGRWGFLVGGRWMRSHDFFKLRRINRDGTRATA